MPEKEVTNLTTSWEALMELYATAITESEIEQSGKRYTNDLLFTPGTQSFRDFIEGSNYTGE